MDPVVALNSFPGDSEEEVRLVAEFCDAERVALARSTAFSEGSAGAVELAGMVIEAAGRGVRSGSLYSGRDPFRANLEKIVRQVYGGRRGLLH